MTISYVELGWKKCLFINDDKLLLKNGRKKAFNFSEDETFNKMKMAGKNLVPFFNNENLIMLNIRRKNPRFTLIEHHVHGLRTGYGWVVWVEYQDYDDQ